MPRLAANIPTLFTELPFLDRIDAAAAAGFTAVECQFPYAADATAIAERLARAAMQLVLFNSPPGRPESGERGLASLPGREADFDASIRLAAQYAQATGCRRVHVMAGLLPPGSERLRYIEQFVSGIARAADQLAGVGATVLIEPINTRVDVPGYLLDGTTLALECIANAGRSNLQLQYDVYHMQIMEGDLMRSIERLLPAIGHIQVADNPGRHEPGSGEINFRRLLERIDALGYSGFVGCEYVPESTTLAGLAWARPWLRGGA
jgi:hydroxypyruvate isomerase